MEKKANPTKMFLGLLAVVLGLIVLLVGMVTELSELTYYILLEAGMLLVGLGLAHIAVTVRWMEELRKLRENEEAIGWQLAVFFATIPACIFAWFVAAWPTDMVWQTVTGIVTFTGPEANAVNLVRQIVALLVGAAIFFSIIWLWVNAHRSAENV